MKDKLSRNKQVLKLDESEYQFIQEFVKENSLITDCKENSEYMKEYLQFQIKTCKIELFSTKAKNTGKFSFFFMFFEDISVEKRLFFTKEHTSMQIGRIIAEDSLTTFQIYQIIFTPKEYHSFLHKYEHQNPHEDEIFYDQDDFVYNRDFLEISLIKQISPKSVQINISIKPFEYIFNYEVFTRIKYFLNPKNYVKDKENSYNSYTKYNDFLNDGKAKAEEFIKEKIKSFFGNTFDLKLNIASFDACFIIPDSVSREKSPILLIMYENFTLMTPEKEEYKMELKSDAISKPVVVDPDCMNEDLWKIRVNVNNFAAKFITFNQNTANLNQNTAVIYLFLFLKKGKFLKIPYIFINFTSKC